VGLLVARIIRYNQAKKRSYVKKGEFKTHQQHPDIIIIVALLEATGYNRFNNTPPDSGSGRSKLHG
jgi:hypothetical protein